MTQDGKPMVPERRVETREISGVSFKGVVVAGSVIDHFLRNNGNPEDLFLQSAHFLKLSGSSRKALVQLNDPRLGVSPQEVVIKEFRAKNILHSLKPLFCQHRAQVIWQVSWHLLNHGVSVPEAEGYLIKKKGPFSPRGYFYSKVLSGCNNLGMLARTSGELSSRLDSGGLIAALAHEIASLHASGVIHGDLKWSNILLHERKNKLWFVDLESAKICDYTPGPARVVADLARFVLYGLEVGIDNTIMDRFLDEYAFHRKLERRSIDGLMAKALRKLWKKRRSIGEDSIKKVIRSY